MFEGIRRRIVGLTSKNVLQTPEGKTKRPKLVKKTRIIRVDFKNKKWIEGFDVEYEQSAWEMKQAYIDKLNKRK